MPQSKGRKREYMRGYMARRRALAREYHDQDGDCLPSPDLGRAREGTNKPSAMYGPLVPAEVLASRRLWGLNSRQTLDYMRYINARGKTIAEVLLPSGAIGYVAVPLLPPEQDGRNSADSAPS